MWGGDRRFNQSTHASHQRLSLLCYHSRLMKHTVGTPQQKWSSSHSELNSAKHRQEQIDNLFVIKNPNRHTKTSGNIAHKQTDLYRDINFTRVQRDEDIRILVTYYTDITVQTKNHTYTLRPIFPSHHVTFDRLTNDTRHFDDVMYA